MSSGELMLIENKVQRKSDNFCFWHEKVPKCLFYTVEQKDENSISLS